MNCGSPTTEMFAKFCPSCGKSLIKSAVSSANTPKISKIAQIIEEDDETTTFNETPTVNELKIELDEDSGLNRESLSNLSKAQKTGFTRDIPADIKKMNKKQLKKHVLDEFNREASNQKRGK